MERSGNIFNKGMSQDNTEKLQPKGSYRFALNSILESKEGNFGSIMNEEGNGLCANFPEGYLPIGSILLPNKETVVFLAHDDKSKPSIIGIQDCNCEFEALITSSCLNFDPCYPIKGEVSVRKGCENVIYFVDGNNPDRSIDLGNLEYYITPQEECIEVADVTVIKDTQIDPPFSGTFPMHTLVHNEVALETISGDTFAVIYVYINTSYPYFETTTSVLDPADVAAFSGIHPSPPGYTDYIKGTSGTNAVIIAVPGNIGVAASFTLKTTHTNNIDFNTFFEEDVELSIDLTGGTPFSVSILSTAGSPTPIIQNIETTVSQDDQCQTLPEISPDAANSTDAWNCNMMTLGCRDLRLPKIKLEGVNNSGGELQYGTYQLVLAYGDEDFNYTNWFVPVAPVPIVFDNYQADFDSIRGGINSEKPPSTKSIVYNISNIDPQFSYLRVGVIASIDETSTAYVADVLPIEDDLATFTLKGINQEVAEPINIGEIITPKPCYTTSKAITQIDNRLFRGNTQVRKIDFAQLQEIANNICVRYFTKPLLAKQDTSFAANIKTGNYYYNFRSYMRDEIYALGWVPIFADGSEGPAFHIPGRAKDTPSSCSPLADSEAGRIAYNAHVYTLNNHTRTPSIETDRWDTVSQVFTTDYNEHLVRAGVTKKGETGTPGAEYAYWQVHNTAVQTSIDPTAFEFADSPTTNAIYTEGELAYWESEDYVYPDVEDCDGNKVYGNLAGTPVRHHKMPDTTLEPAYLTPTTGKSGIGGFFDGEFDYDDDRTYIIPLGLTFENVIIPNDLQDTIVGWRIVRARRTVDNRTVIDKGIIYNNAAFNAIVGEIDKEDNYQQYHVQSHPYNKHRNASTNILDLEVNGDSQSGTPPKHWAVNENQLDIEDLEPTDSFQLDYHFSYHGPLTKFESNSIGASHIKVEKILVGRVEYLCSFADNIGSDDKNIRSQCLYTDQVVPDRTAWWGAINQQAYLEPNVILYPGIFNEAFLNASQQEAYVISMHRNMPLPDETPEVPEDRVYRQGISSVYYTSLKKVNPNMYNALHNVEYIPVSNNHIESNVTSTREFGGDCFISQLSFRKTYWSRDQPLGEDLFERSLVVFYTESAINSELRSEGDIQNLCDSYWPLSKGCNFIDLDFYRVLTLPEFADDYEEARAEFTLNVDKKALRAVASDLFATNRYCINYYAYNKDYSKENSERIFFPLSLGFDFCSDCDNEFPNRIVYSDLAQEGERPDAYRVYQTASAVDIPSDSGEITNLFVDKDNFYVHTDFGIWRIQTKPNQIETNESTIFVGTGDFLSVPPKKLVSTDYGYGGSQHWLATETTEFGTIFASAKEGKVFNIAKGLDEISNAGMRNWFENNLPMQLPVQMKKLDRDCGCMDTAPTSPYGIGLLATYDPRYRRYILAKKDYQIIDESLVEDGTLDCKEDGRWHLIESYGTNVPCGCPEGFESGESQINPPEEVCISISGLQKTTNVYAFFDKTSLSWCNAQAAFDNLQGWFNTYKLDHPDYEGELYTLPVDWEMWLAWAPYPWTGTLENGTLEGVVAEGFTFPPNTTGNVLFKEVDVDGGVCTPKPGLTLYDWSSFVNLPPDADPDTGAFAGQDLNSLVIVFADEASQNADVVYPGQPMYHDQDIGGTRQIFEVLENPYDPPNLFTYPEDISIQSFFEPTGDSNRDWRGFEYQTPGFQVDYRYVGGVPVASTGNDTRPNGLPQPLERAIQPTSAYRLDFQTFVKAHREIIDAGGSFRGFLYPVIDHRGRLLEFVDPNTPPIGSATIFRNSFIGKKFLLHTMGAMYANINGTGIWNETFNGPLPVNWPGTGPFNPVNLEAMLTYNPYNELGDPLSSNYIPEAYLGPGLIEYGWGIAPDIAIETDTGAADVFDDRFVDDLTEFIEQEDVETIEIPCNTKFVKPEERPDLFVNLSWTISYSFVHKAWASFHSYSPNYMWNDTDTFYSSRYYSPNTWEHNVRNFQTYYGTKYDHIIEFIVNPSPEQEKKFNSIQYVSETKLYSPLEKSFIDIPLSTFDRVVAYTTNQTTGLKDLLPKTREYQNIEFNPQNILVDKTDNNWRFNYIRDMVVDRTVPLFTSNWTEPTYQAEFLNRGYLDKVVNPNSIDFNKSVYKQQRLRDKFMGVRLYFNTPEDYKIVTDILATLKSNSLR
jgi:hypothetical protein